MKKMIYFFMATLLCVVMISCGGNQKAGQLERERDSIASIKAQQDLILQDLTSTLDEVYNSFDSITIEENTIKRKIEEGNYVSKQQLTESLKNLKDMVTNYRTRLNQMESQLSSRKDELAKLSEMMKILTLELEKKEMQIDNLQAEILKKNTTIANLKNNVVNLEETVSNLEMESVAQKETIKNLREVYYIVGTYKELKEKKVLTGGFLKKKKVDLTQFDLNCFKKSDLQSLEKIDIPAKSVKKIHTNVPSGSYSIEKTSENSCSIKIIDAEKFWSISKVLVVEI